MKMMSARRARCFAAAVLVAALAVAQGARGQTTGRIAGTVTDQTGGAIAGAEVTSASRATRDQRKVATDETGNYAIPLLPPGTYRVSVTAAGFQRAVFAEVEVRITETTSLNCVLTVGAVADSVTARAIAPLVQTDSAQLGRVIEARTVSELPLATRNFTQILSLSSGTATYLPDSTGVGRNTQAVSVNGARVTQNNLQINGVDANTMGTNGPVLVAVPAPETIQEFIVQTSLYDASFGRAGGANVQVLTRSGSNSFHGSAYEYLRNEALNANNPFLKAAGMARPVLKRNVFGGTIGGPLRREKAFFFASYQGSREVNAASIINSLSQSILVAPGLTDDRSASTLQGTFRVSAIDPAALALLNAKLPDGSFVIPTPQPNGRYSGSSRSTFQEDQFNANTDFHLGSKNSLSAKVFFADTSGFLALPSFRGTGPNVPGFGTEQTFNNRVVAIQDIHAFSPTLLNEVRLGYAFNSNSTVPREPVTDAQVGIARANAASLPGLPLIRIAPGAGGIIFGTPSNINPAKPSVATLYDSVSLLRGKHTLRLGLEIRYNTVNFATKQLQWGQIDFQTFNSFLAGTVLTSSLGDGIGDRSQRAWDYNFFVQDNWKATAELTLNFGLRYELDLPVYDTRGRLSTFDPALYQPRQQLANGVPVGPPVGGLVQEGNVIASFDLPNIPNVEKGLLRSVSPTNLAPRIGFAYAPGQSARFVIRGGYGIFHSRPTFQYASLVATLPPAYVIGVRNTAPVPLANPFFALPSKDEFPTLVPGIDLAGAAFDRDLRTPYIQQFNLSLQYKLTQHMVWEVAYAGTRGANLFRQVAINQARLASPQSPITNEVTNAVIITNTPTNAQLRAPFQGVSITGFTLNQSTAQSTYHSLQTSVTQQLSHGLQFLASYNYAKSIDNASGAGGGAGIGGVVNTGAVGDTGPILGRQLDPRANRGASDFDRTHRFVLSSVWDLPGPGAAKFFKRLASNWQVSSIVTAMSGLPIDIVDTGAGSFYGLANGANPLARPNLLPGDTCQSAKQSVPPGFFFNPRVFARPVVLPGMPIPSSGGAATAAASGTDIGNVDRNCLRGPKQVNVDFGVAKSFPFTESTNLEFRTEFFNLFNHVNLANPISNATAASVDSTTGQVVSPGNFGRIISTSSNPRIIQFAAKLIF